MPIWPDRIRPEVVAAVRAAGIDHPWEHQALAAAHALRGESVVIATGTASGKSLAYLAPVLSALLDGADAVSRKAGPGRTSARTKPSVPTKRNVSAAESDGTGADTVTTNTGPATADVDAGGADPRGAGLGGTGLGGTDGQPGAGGAAGAPGAGGAAGAAVVDGDAVAANAFAVAGRQARVTGRGATALYLAPTKALAADQRRAVAELAAPLGTAVRPAVYDGDTPFEEREWVRQYATYVLTNPDMLHRGILPGHARWASFLRQLRYVVIDECHTYRGVFGSHVAQVLRRLRRICARYGAHPVFLLASATAADPARAAGPAHRRAGRRGHRRRLTARRAGLRPLGAAADRADAARRGAPVRRTATAEAADLLTDLVRAGRPHRRLRTLPARRRAGRAASRRSASPRSTARCPTRVAAYRGGYLPEERRALERDLHSGRLLGLASTTALELGMDVSGLDAVLLAGYPGTRASLWQQAGRAGRAGQGALAVLVGPRRPAGHLPRPPPGGAVRRSRWSPPSSTRTTPTSWRRTCAPPPRNSRSPRRTWTSSAPRRAGLAAAAGEARAAAAPVRGLVLDPPGAGRRPHRHPRRGRPTRSRSWRRRPAACWAPSTPPRRTPPCTTARSTSTRAAPTWSSAWTWRTPSPWSRRPTRRTPRWPATPPPSPSWAPTPNSPGGRPACASARSR